MAVRACALCLCLLAVVHAQLGMAPLTAPPVPAYLLRKEGAPLRGSPPAQAAPAAAAPSLLSSGVAQLNYLRGVASGNMPVALVLFSALFLVKVAFCIPGGTLLNAVGGALFGAYLAVPLVLVLSVLGSCGAYLLSFTFGGALIARWRLDTRLAPLRQRVNAANAVGALPRLLVSLRMLPLFPQWLVNLGAPHLGISLPLFMQTSAIGLTPYVLATVSAGAALSAALDSAAAAAASASGASAGPSFASLLPPHVIAMLCCAALAVALGPPLYDYLCSAATASDKDSSAGSSSSSSSSGSSTSPSAHSPSAAGV